MTATPRSVRLRLDHPAPLEHRSPKDKGWSLTIGDTVAGPTRALDITRNLIGPTRASVTIVLRPSRIGFIAFAIPKSATIFWS